MEDFLKEVVIDLVLESTKLNDSKKTKLIKFVRDQAEIGHLNIILTDSDYLGLTESDFIFLSESPLSDLTSDMDKLSGFEKGLKQGSDIGWEQGQKAGMVKGAGAVAAAVVAAAIIAYAYKYYKNNINKMGKACKQWSSGSKQRLDCEKKFKTMALQTQIKTLSKGKSKCKQSKNPKTCSAKVDAKIANLKVKLAKL